MKKIKKLLTIGLAVLLMLCMGVCFVGCEGFNEIKRGPQSIQLCTTYYGVVETVEEYNEKFVYIDGVGHCEIPAYEKQIDVNEGDLLIMSFYTNDLQIMECYPARFSKSVDNMIVTDFSFSLTWGTYGISSYDSATGRLIKTSDVGNNEDYETTHFLTAQEKVRIFAIIEQLNPYIYPDEYNPTEGIATVPYQNLILSVEMYDETKTITAKQVAFDKATSPEGKRFMDACKKIVDILKNTDEWKSLPDYPYLYD